MPDYNQSVWRHKGSNPTTRLTCQKTSNLSWANYQTKAVFFFLQNYKKTKNMTISWELQPHFHVLLCIRIPRLPNYTASGPEDTQHDSLLSSLPTVSFFRFSRSHQHRIVFLYTAILWRGEMQYYVLVLNRYYCIFWTWIRKTCYS